MSRASVMCTLCATAGTIEMDLDTPEGQTDAVLWGLHFARLHPDVVPAGNFGQHIVVTQPTPL